MTRSSTTTGSSAKTEGKAREALREKKAELRDRTTQFAKNVRTFVRKTPRTIASLSDCRRLVFASGAIGSHYISADESPSRQDFLRRISDCRKESKQSGHWLQLLDSNLEESSEEQRAQLLKEAQELERIFGAIVGKTIANARKEETGEEQA